MELNKRLISLTSLMVVLLATVTFQSKAQEDIFGIDRKIKSKKSESEVGNAFRNAVSNFSFELSTGAGYHENRLIFNSEMPENYPITDLSTMEPAELTIEDTISFRNNNFAYPLNLGVRLNLFDMLVVGAGYGREWGSFDEFNGAGNTFTLEEEQYTYDKFYGTVGLILWDAKKRGAFLRWQYRKYSEGNISMQNQLKQRARQFYPWRIIAEGEFGSMKLKKSLDPRLTASSGYYGVGLRFERDLSEYSKVFIKPAAEFRPYEYNMTDPMEIQSLKQSIYTLQVGVSMSLPGSKRCKVAGCKVVMKHLHNGVEYRGSSIWKRQNRKVGQWYGN
ncbi:hypothetical protein [Cyclobacterium qasimii]|uniref:Outer membrane protein beta-barrel domain-containing protein n=2 Tax=Cyclobacterium qasimii TaxID=1350429 RepID=A0A512C7H8_9BACT|nr:hypothetical protein [Cyclobacterium qasimii]GEO20120.1 hypothetical protein CQA01_06540 [Cyclobacterium qasimii]